MNFEPTEEQKRGYGNAFCCDDPPHLLGGWAEYLYVLPQAFLYRVPPALPLRVAVMVELMAVSYNLDRTKEFFSLSGDGFSLFPEEDRSPCLSVPTSLNW